MLAHLLYSLAYPIMRDGQVRPYYLQSLFSVLLACAPVLATETGDLSDNTTYT